jgi:hypothetical protein
VIHSVIIRPNKVKVYKIIFLILTIVVTRTHAQNGFVKTKSDSIVEGFIRYDYNLYDPEKGVKIKIYRTKKDRHPIIFYETEVLEHSYKGDHYLNLFNETPLKDKPQEVYSFLKTKIINKTDKYSMVSFTVSKGKSMYSSSPTGTGMIYMGNTGDDIDYLLINNNTREIERKFKSINEAVLFLTEYIDDPTVIEKCSIKKNKEKDIIILVDAIKNKTNHNNGEHP